MKNSVLKFLFVGHIYIMKYCLLFSLHLYG